MLLMCLVNTFHASLDISLTSLCIILASVKCISFVSLVCEGYIYFLEIIRTQRNPMHKVNRKLATRIQKSLQEIGIKVNSEK